MNSAEQLSQYEPEKEKDFNLADTVEYSALDYKKFRRELILDIKKANGFEEVFKALKKHHRSDMVESINKAREDLSYLVDKYGGNYKFKNFEYTFQNVFKSEEIALKFSLFDKTLDKLLRNKIIYLFKKELKLR